MAATASFALYNRHEISIHHLTIRNRKPRDFRDHIPRFLGSNLVADILHHKITSNQLPTSSNLRSQCGQLVARKDAPEYIPSSQMSGSRRSPWLLGNPMGQKSIVSEQGSWSHVPAGFYGAHKGARVDPRYGMGKNLPTASSKAFC